MSRESAGYPGKGGRAGFFGAKADAAAAETVARHLVQAQALAPAEETLGILRARLALQRVGRLELILVTDPAGRLVGVLPVSRLFALPDAVCVGEAMQADFPRISPDSDQESAASLALHHGVDALPVVDGDNRPLGVMPSHALLQTLRREHVEDLHLLAGIERESVQARHAIEDPPLRRARHRLPWLLIGLAGSAVATAAMAAFEGTLRAHVAVAFFIPALVYLADAVGTQSEAIAVRGLSLTRSGIGHLLAGELRTGLLLGGTLGLISFPAVLLAFGDLRLALAVSLAMLLAVSVASGVGMGFPWLLARLGRDPALGSGPIATVVQDIVTLLVYFLIVGIIMP